MRRLFLGLVLLVGCGSGDGGSDPGNPLAETRWSMVVDSACALGIGFETDTDYRVTFICLLNDGSHGASIEDGLYYVDGNTLALSPHAATCPATCSAFQFDVTGDSLTLSDSTGILALTRLPPGGGDGVVTYGCFDAQGNFTPAELRPL